MSERAKWYKRIWAEVLLWLTLTIFSATAVQAYFYGISPEILCIQIGWPIAAICFWLAALARFSRPTD